MKKNSGSLIDFSDRYISYHCSFCYLEGLEARSLLAGGEWECSGNLQGAGLDDYSFKIKEMGVMNALLDWENDLENLTKSVDGALKSIEQNDELGDLEKAEARLNKLDKIMDAFGPVNRLKQILVPSIQAYHELIECSRVPNVVDAAEQVVKDLTDRTGALSHQLVGLNRLKFQLQREIKLQKAAQLHLPIALMVNSRDSFSSSSCDSQVETDFLSKIGSTLAFLTYSIYEYARSLDIQEQQPKEELERLEQKMSAFEFEMALLREGLSQCNSNALELSSIIQEMNLVKKEEGGVKSSEAENPINLT